MLYRSGDLGRLLQSEEIEYLGRLDSQIKIRGHRVELLEIQVLLEAHPLVRAARLTFERPSQYPMASRIDAFVLAEPDLDLSDLRRYLAERLPKYVRPASITCVHDFPLTEHAKLDVARLRELRQKRPLFPGRRPPETPSGENKLYRYT